MTAEVKQARDRKPAEIERLNNLITEHTQLNSDSICARIQALNQRDAAQAEADQLRAQVAALEAQIAIAKAIIKRGADYDLHSIDAECTEEWHGELYALALEVKRLREPVGLVWRSTVCRDFRSQEINGAWYEVCTGCVDFYAVYCDAKTRRLLTERGAEDAVKAACAAHHAARYREMQAKPEPKDAPK